MKKELKFIGDYTFIPYKEVKIEGALIPIGIYNVPKKHNFFKKRFRIKNAYPKLKKPFNLIGSVIGAISQEFYDKLIEELIKGGGQGDNDAWIGFDKEKNKACFEFNFCLPEGDPHAEITYTDSVKLFHAYFNAYKKFVEECAPEIKEKLYFYTKKKWYPRFLEALKKLNKYYEEMVEKGEIEE